MEESSPNFHHHVPAEEADHGLLRRPLSSISGNGLCYYNYWIHNNDYSNSGSISRGDEATDKPMSEFSFPKSAESLTSTTLGFAELHLGPSLAEGKDHGDDHTRVLREKLMLKTSFVEKREDCYDHGDSLMVSRDYPGIFGHVYPSMDFSKDQRSAALLLDCYEASASAPAAFNFLREKNSPRLNDDSGEIASDDNTLGLVRGNLPLDPHDVLSPSTRHRRTEIAASSFAGKKLRSDSKRPSYSPEEKVDGEAAPKKKKVEANPPWKARKEKLGDKVAALQQLVAPFGKTDTASVLMEAIGYIKFLQSQVLTLCVPYMKSSREEDVGPPSRAGLQPGGLCLVPLSCMTLVPSDGAGDGGGGGFWPPVPYYGGS